MQLNRREFIKYGVAATGGLLLPMPTWAGSICPTFTQPAPNRKLYSPKELSHLTVTLHPYRWKRHLRQLALVEEGLKRHGLNPTWEKADIPIDSDVAMGWAGGRHKRLKKHRREKGLNTLLMEYGFFQPRRQWVSAAWEGVNNCGNYVEVTSNEERWEQHFAHHLKPWKEDRKGYILLMGQVPGDRALYGIKMDKWLNQMGPMLAKHYDKNIVFRPHPRMRKKYTRDNNPKQIPPQTTFSQHKNLLDDLMGAAFSVTYSSTAAVESVLAGIPCVTIHEGSIARPVTSQHILQPYYTPDRTEWCHETAWKQWSEEEVRNGDMWDVAKQYLLA